MSDAPSTSSRLSSAPHVLVTVTGPDTPGITAALTRIIAEGNADLLDIEQVVVQGQLTLCLLLGFEREGKEHSGESVLKDLLFASKDMGLELDFRVVNVDEDAPLASTDRQRWVVTALGDTIGASAVHLVSDVLARHQANIDYIRRLTDDHLSSFEIVLSLPPGEARAVALRKDLTVAVHDERIDVAVQPEALTRRSKRLVVMDMDSTLIPIEIIDELARLHGVHDQVAAVTERAMQGELDFEASLKARVHLLKGLEYDRVVRFAQDIPVTDGAEVMLKVLRGLGMKTGVISGGFTVAADVLKKRLGLDYAYANVLVVEDGKLTGEVKLPIVGPQRKADLLETIAQQEEISLEQTVAIGDGANDADMLEKAGLGIAFHAKPKLKERADTSVSAGGLDRILYLLGLRERDVRAALEREPG